MEQSRYRRRMHGLLTLAAWALLVLGVAQVAEAQYDGCKMDIRDHPTIPGKYKKHSSCNTSHVCFSPFVCKTGTSTNGYELCYCPFGDTFCLLGFDPDTPGGTTGDAMCFTVNCTGDCLLMGDPGDPLNCDCLP